VVDYVAMDQNPDSTVDSSKRKATPVSVTNLKRSKRNAFSSNGLKPATHMAPKSRKKQQKTTGKMQ
jgi:hypothetical protein